MSESDMLSTVSESSGPEVWSETESSDGDNTEENSRDTDANILVQNMFCLCLTFIQLCYKISDRAIVCLLTVIGTIFQFLSSTSPSNVVLRNFAKYFPKTIYSL